MIKKLIAGIKSTIKKVLLKTETVCQKTAHSFFMYLSGIYFNGFTNQDFIRYRQNSK